MASFLSLVTLLVLSSTVIAENIDCRTSKCKCKQPGHCQIFCDSAAGQCRSAKLRCLPGYPCTIYCLGDGVCFDAKISGNDATHVDLLCDGKAACQSGKYYCGSGDCTLQCASSGDCADLRALTTAKARSWKCNGFCPSTLPSPITPAPTSLINNNIGRPTKKPTAKPVAPKPTAKPTKPTPKPTKKPTAPTPKPVAVAVYPTPRPTSKPVVSQELTCKGTGKQCKCDGTRPCRIKCGGNHCTENTLKCPRNHDCTVTCGNNACIKAVIEGPRGKNFNLECKGTASCVDAQIDSQLANDVKYVCSGKDACKGALTSVNCGKGLCDLEFSGEAAGTDAKIHTNKALGFYCSGRYAFCPDNYDPPCSGISSKDCTSAQFFNLATCRCECPYNPDGTSCPNALQVFNPLTCKCELQCPSSAPTEAQCKAKGLEWRDCKCEGSNYCCLTSSAALDYKLWAGFCWDETTEEGCNAEPNGRCTWTPDNCLPNPPVNTLNRKKACKFTNQQCSKDKECCSEFCKVDGSCR